MRPLPDAYLVNNAFKYGSAETQVTIRASVRGNEATLSVKNEGNPLSEEEQRTLFDPYRRSKSAEEGDQIGWGLGLTLVRGMMEAHGGSVRVTSSLADGTVFTLTLPLLNPAR